MRGDHQNTTEPNREEYVNFFMTQAKFFDTPPPPPPQGRDWVLRSAQLIHVPKLRQRYLHLCNTRSVKFHWHRASESQPCFSLPFPAIN